MSTSHSYAHLIAALHIAPRVDDIIFLGVQGRQFAVFVHTAPLYRLKSEPSAEIVYGLLHLELILTLPRICIEIQLVWAGIHHQFGNPDADAPDGLIPVIIGPEQLQGRSGNFRGNIGGNLTFSLTGKGKQSVIPNRQFHDISNKSILTEPGGNAFSEKMNDDGHILVCGQIPEGGGAVSNTLDGRG